MSVPASEDGARDTPHGVWLTDREPGELLGTRRVVARLEGDEVLALGEAPGREEADALAESVLREIEQAAACGEWVELGDRLVRPDAILSIDVEFAG